MAVLESHHYHHQMWYFSMNLFGKSVIRRIILDEDSDDEPHYYEHSHAGSVGRPRNMRAGTMSSNGRSTAASVRTDTEATTASEDGLDDESD